jgi:hypothetical protein
MKTGAPAGSGVTGSRRILTADTATSSSAQPVTGIEPVTPVTRLSGVSKMPNAAAEVEPG